MGGRGGTWGDAERRSLEEVALEEGLCVEPVPRRGVAELDATNRSAGGGSEPATAVFLRCAMTNTKLADEYGRCFDCRFASAPQGPGTRARLGNTSVVCG